MRQKLANPLARFFKKVFAVILKSVRAKTAHALKSVSFSPGGHISGPWILYLNSKKRPLFNYFLVWECSSFAQMPFFFVCEPILIILKYVDNKDVNFYFITDFL